MTVIGSMLTQSIGDGLRATIISVARQGIFLIPLLLVLPPTIGLLGLQAAQPLGDVFSCLLTWVLTRGCLEDMKRRWDARNDTEKGR